MEIAGQATFGKTGDESRAALEAPMVPAPVP